MARIMQCLPAVVAVDEATASLGVDVFVGGEKIGGKAAIPHPLPCLGESTMRRVSINILLSVYVKLTDDGCCSDSLGDV